MANLYPKRTQRKQASRAALIDAAIVLFSRQGYEETKLEEVAERAGLHVQTLYRHFSNKRDLATAVDQHFLHRFQTACGSRREDTLHFWRSWVERAATELMRNSARYKKTVHDLYGVPYFPTPYLQIWHDYELTLAENLAEDMGPELHDERLPILIACMLWGGASHAFRNWIACGSETDLVVESVAMVDTVIEQFGDC